MEVEKNWYLFRFFGHLMTTNEMCAHRHLVATAKGMHGHTNINAQTELRNSRPDLRKFLSSDPEVLRLTGGGLEQFVARTAERILAEHKNEIVFNYCPNCSALLERRKPASVAFVDLTGTHPEPWASNSRRIRFRSNRTYSVLLNPFAVASFFGALAARRPSLFLAVSCRL
jgi:hypothetical protein